MRFVIMSNGDYGELEYYIPYIRSADRLICADGGANYAYQLNLKPDIIVGDLDSITSEVRHFYHKQNVSIKKYLKQKDFTDTQLALSMAEEMGATEIVLIGTMGGRLDHSFSNLYAGVEQTKKGIIVCHVTNDCVIHIFNNYLEIEGAPGDIVSIMPLTEEIGHVYTEGLEYALNGESLVYQNPYAISNVLVENRASVRLEEGIGVLFHYYQL